MKDILETLAPTTREPRARECVQVRLFGAHSCATHTSERVMMSASAGHHACTFDIEIHACKCGYTWER